MRTKHLLAFMVCFLSSSIIIGQSWSLTGNSGTSSSTNYVGTSDNTTLNFRTNNTQRMTIDNSGKVGIGVSAPAEKLEIDGKVRFGTTSKATMDAWTDGTHTNVVFSNATYGSTYVNAARFGGGVYSVTQQYLDLRGNGVAIKSYTTYLTEGALDLNTTTNITTAGYKLFTVKNQDVMKSYIDKDGGAWFNGSVGIGTTNISDAANIGLPVSLLAPNLKDH